MKKTICILLSVVFVLFCFCSCKKKYEDVNIIITIKDYGQMKFELYPEIAPVTVQNFVDLVKAGFYDGLTIHRVSKDFVIQGGDPNGDGTGGSDKKIKGEFSSNGWNKNTLSHKKGVISMARSDAPDSASLQFFICTADAPHLDGNYAAFGALVSGWDVLDSLNNVPTKGGSQKEVPTEKIYIESIRIAGDTSSASDSDSSEQTYADTAQ